MGYVTKEETECKSCGRIIRKNELQYDSPKGRICSYCYTGKQPQQPPRMPETIGSEKLLGCIRVTGLLDGQVLAFTPNRVFGARLPTGAILGGGYGGDPIGIAFFVIDMLSVLSKGGKTEESVMTNLEEFLKADEMRFVMPNSEIREVELKKRPSVRLLCDLKITTYRNERIQWCVEGLIPEKKDVKLEDYENMLLSAFGDKLSVKK